LVVASVLRLSGHGEHDDASYVTEEIKREPFARDCLKVAEQTIAAGFDGVSEAVAACPGTRVPGKTLGKITTANNNLAMAA
jgi:TPP-dependent pyruvate/acetoin dehydrogenase alpha subunit